MEFPRLERHLLPFAQFLLVNLDWNKKCLPAVPFFSTYICQACYDITTEAVGYWVRVYVNFDSGCYVLYCTDIRISLNTKMMEHNSKFVFVSVFYNRAPVKLQRLPTDWLTLSVENNVHLYSCSFSFPYCSREEKRSWGSCYVVLIILGEIKTSKNIPIVEHTVFLNTSL